MRTRQMRRIFSIGPLLALVLGLVLTLSVDDVTARSKRGKKGKKEKVVEEKPPEPVWPSPLDPGVFDPVFRELPFGQERGAFEMTLKERFDSQMLPLLRATLDARERDILKAKVEKTFEDVVKSFTPLDGGEKGYGVSVVAGAFVTKADESVYKYAYSDNSAYFFNSANKLWKVFICTEAATDYSTLLVDLATKYGDPLEMTHEDEEKTIPVAALWRDTTFELVALPPEGIFVCSRLVWTYLPSVQAVEERRASVQKEVKGDGSADAFLMQVTGQEEKQDPDVMDEILKKKKKKKKKNK
jgi:hypothetical protein